MPGKNKVLLAPGWTINTSQKNKTTLRLREWVWKFEEWRAKQNRNFRTELLGFIEDE